MESEELLSVICLVANADVDNGEGTVCGDTPICTVASDCVTKTKAGTQFLYNINWEPGNVQPGLIGGEHCFAFNSGETWVPYRPPKLAIWRYFTAAIVFDRLKMMNDGVVVRDLVKYTRVFRETLAEKGEIRLNDFFYDREECSQQWVVFDSRGVGDGVCNDNDARRDARCGWVQSTIPCEYGKIRMIVHDLIGNCWSTVYINDEFISRYLEFEMLEFFDAATGEPTIPLENPVFSPIVEGKVFWGEDNICLWHVRGKELTYDGLLVNIWDSDRTARERLSAIDISVTVISQSELNRHSSDDMYGYHVNWVPHVFHPAIFENKVTMAARLRSGEWVPMGWMPSGVVEHWHFMVVLARVSLCNARVKDKALLCEHAKLCWDTLKAEDRQMVLCGYDGCEDENMWSMQGAGVGTCFLNDFPNNCLSLLRRIHGRTTLLGWVPVVCPMRYACGADLCMIFRDSLGVPFFVTYSNGLLRHIQYMPMEDMAGNDYNVGIREPEFEETEQPTCEVNGPPQDTGAGCDIDEPAADTGAGCAVVDKSTPSCGTMCNDGSRRMGQGTKRKATTRRENGGTMTIAGAGGQQWLEEEGEEEGEEGGGGMRGQQWMGRQGGKLMEAKGLRGGIAKLDRLLWQKCAGCSATQTFASLTDHL
ncbi:hypothetical protein CBR_g4438 [Chara braunii]|uniref:Uncharacterized protein n=1 Tax=Chara braunii TaxID=69332 RepID=A0A388KHX4_CHABU|nr:hypothetical protein CBR_g4438 [Chara braunii]|eukprot:GBG69608.1 hypothetical protein CBR_g4438 [Chara braunii]